MIYVYLYTRFLLEAIFIQPIKCVIQLVVGWLWYPSLKDDRYNKSFSNFEYKDEKELSKIVEYAGIQTDISRSRFALENFRSDGFKWLAILTGSLLNSAIRLDKTRFVKDPNRFLETNLDKLRLCLSNYITPYGYISRYTDDLLYEKEKASSVDQTILSGLLYWLAQEMRYLWYTRTELKQYINKNSPYTILNMKHAPLVRKVCLLFDKTTFSFHSPASIFRTPLQIDHAAQELGENKKGYKLWSIGSFGPELIQLLAWLRIGYLWTESRRYKYLYWFIFVLFTPMRLTNPGDMNIFVGRVHRTSWKDAHSFFYTHLAFWSLTNSNHTRRLLQKQINKYKHNVAFKCAYLAHFFNQKDIEQLPQYHRILLELDKCKGTRKYLGSLKRYFSLLTFKLETLAGEYLLPRYLGRATVYDNCLHNPYWIKNGKIEDTKDTNKINTENLINRVHLMK